MKTILQARTRLDLEELEEEFPEQNDLAQLFGDLLLGFEPFRKMRIEVALFFGGKIIKNRALELSVLGDRSNRSTLSASFTSEETLEFLINIDNEEVKNIWKDDESWEMGIYELLRRFVEVTEYKGEITVEFTKHKIHTLVV